MNKSDSERIAAVLENIGYKKAQNENEADLLVVNACSVRQSAIDRVYGLAEKLSNFKTKKRGLKTLLTGCLLRADKNKLRQRFDYVLDIKTLSLWPKLLNGQSKRLPANYLDVMPAYQSAFSAFVPISTGCNNFCSYCAVPYAKGREICRPADKIVAEIKNLVKSGYKEIWLLGQNVNSYKDGNTDFSCLLKIVNNIPGDFWIRFTSSHPKDFSDKLIEAMAGCEKVTEYLNLPVQAGDNKVLKSMNRPYTIKHYESIIAKLRKKIPNLTLSTDVIVGFPSETKKQFANTAKLFRKIKFDMAYIAEYSPRPATSASRLKDSVSSAEKKQRRQTLTDILRETALEKNREYLGKKVLVLPEQWQKGFLTGKSREYKTVKLKGPKNLVGNFTPVKIIASLSWGLTGKILK